MGVPKRTNKDRSDALDIALAARRTRAQAKQELAAGDLSLGELLETDDPALLRMKISDFLRAYTGIGEARAAKIMKTCNIAQSRRIKGLGRKQRESLLETMSEYELLLEC